MPVTVTCAADVPPGATAIILPACVGETPGPGIDAGYLDIHGFEGRPDQLVTLPGPEAGSVIAVVGVGGRADVDAAALRRAAALAIRALPRHEQLALRLLDALPDGDDAGQRHVAAAQAVAEGAVLGGYRFGRYKRPEGGTAEHRQVTIVTGKAGEVATAVELGGLIGEAVLLARDLGNEPGGSLTPMVLAEAAVELAERENLAITVLDEHDLIDRGCGGILGVNRGSTQPPRFIVLRYEPEVAGDVPHVALVGKGITFDSGGLSIKTAEGMMTMKSDMCGAAAILGALSVIRAVAPSVKVTAYLPATDNMTGPDATRPGDVLRIVNGTTVEVLNTDAEGRLILADALALASEDHPDAIVDLATLTGAVERALGTKVAGVFGNDAAWTDTVRAAADRAGEPLWPLPIVDEYRKRLDSEVADLRNIGTTGDGGAIVAALFLREFVGEGIPWAHLDIAGTAWSTETDGEHTKGATGYGVRMLIELLRRAELPGPPAA